MLSYLLNINTFLLAIVLYFPIYTLLKRYYEKKHNLVFGKMRPGRIWVYCACVFLAPILIATQPSGVKGFLFLLTTVFLAIGWLRMRKAVLSLDAPGALEAHKKANAKEYSETLLKKACALEVKGDLAAALTKCEEVVRLYPGTSDARNAEQCAAAVKKMLAGGKIL